MTRLKTLFILIISALIASTFASAQDPGTYRPGQPYSATQADNASICSSQCSGDAACRGWNFVKANPRQKLGICEFNSAAVDPIQSPVSISANVTHVVNPTGQSRIISAGVRTTRIGAPAPAPVVRPQRAPIQKAAIRPAPPQPQQAPAPKAAPQKPQPSTRNIVRQPVPKALPTQAASFRHNLGSVSPQTPQKALAPQKARPAPQAANPYITRTQNGLPPRAPAGLQSAALPQAPNVSGADPRLQQQLINARNRAAQTTKPITAQANAQAAAQAANVAPPQNTPRRGSLIEALTRSGPVASNAALPAAAPQSLNFGPPTSKNLYGHLNDDVSIPKPLSSEDFDTPLDEAIPTVASVPVIPVDRESFSGLAGG